MEHGNLSQTQLFQEKETTWTISSSGLLFVISLKLNYHSFLVIGATKFSKYAFIIKGPQIFNVNNNFFGKKIRWMYDDLTIETSLANMLYRQ